MLASKLVKLEVLNATGDAVAYAVLTPSSGASFRFDDARMRRFDEHTVFPRASFARQLLEDQINALVPGAVIDENLVPDLAHVLQLGLIVTRLPHIVVRHVEPAVVGITAVVLEQRHLLTWLWSADPSQPHPDEPAIDDLPLFVHARRHIDGTWAQVRLLSNEEQVWSVEIGTTLGECAQVATQGSFYLALHEADRLTHTAGDCERRGCGQWLPRLRNVTEWKRFGMA